MGNAQSAAKVLFESEPESVGYPRWFSSRGCVIERDGVHHVYVGGTLVGTYDDARLTERNMLLVQISADPKSHLGKVAKAFEVSSEWLRRLRLRYEQGGLAALQPRELGRNAALRARDRARLERLFEQGLTAAAAHARIKRASLSTVSRAYRAWRAGRAAAAVPTAARTETAEERTLGLPGVEMLPTRAASVETPKATDVSVVAEPQAEEPSASAETLRGGSFIQHVGVWLLIAMLARLGLYRVVLRAAGDRVGPEMVRLALDAAIATFAVGEPTLEGVRRLRTPSAPLLLQSAFIPTPDSLRATMDGVAADFGAIYMHFAMLRTYLESDRLAAAEHAVFYIDNHLRPYTGKRVVRKGWRMQDRRVRPGTTDYYLHDEDGRPLFRVDVPSHDSLPVWMLNIVVHLRAIVGDDDPLLMAFDRGGAFPETMAALGNEGCDFVTYERAPYPKLPESAFAQELELDGEKLRWVESRANLGKGRGRVRRISVRDADGRQVNLLASGMLPAQRLIEVMRGRWRQENAFKYGKERWGINQLDARKTRAVDPDAIIPNPARRRLDVARRAANIREGDGRNTLDRFPELTDPRHQAALGQIAAARQNERDIDALRATTPKHARLADTELADKLVRHDGSRKLVLDTLRIACANAESDLALLLAPHMRKPREAKHLLANILRAPGHVRIGTSILSINLAPAANRSERAAIANFLRDVSHLRLQLPGDPRKRRLTFRAQL